MSLRQWLRACVARLSGRLVWSGRRGEMAMEPLQEQPREPTDRVSLPGEDQMSPESARALERVRAIYHEGSQPLTVAKARYDLIRRGAFDA